MTFSKETPKGNPATPKEAHLPQREFVLAKSENIFLGRSSYYLMLRNVVNIFDIIKKEINEVSYKSNPLLKDHFHHQMPI